MSIKIIQERLNFYRCRSQQEEENALREITQEVALAALSRTDFFKKAAFQGGTCLRIFYSLDRFSEDLDFILKKPDMNFQLEPYLKPLAAELNDYGYRMEIIDRSKTEQAVKKCFLKDDSLGKILSLQHLKGAANQKKIKIKLEVDANPPLGSNFENKFLDFPFAFAVTAQDAPSLFAGKSHALLCREYGKARDWYDFIWYVSRRIVVNFTFLSNALNQIGPWAGQNIQVDNAWYHKEMEKKIISIDWEKMKKELLQFLKPEALDTLKIWSQEFFLDRLRKLC
ncbi:MAG: nucleotidyl transferase AbiEii/AbiGii toxin family protein [Candidatus Omnitrophica bacterium]|nr:nucleotidyl transferase AbiEii/AbiGii toxin family protein [Candidatus Omnitrophota bacterium]MBU1926078.1 nucleotidyl transferase AbiEii/AbiGii toxin family protein [Candidatus Omnitrophota bacterium]